MDNAAWNPAQYLKFGDERLRPGYELLARVGDLPPGPIYDLGCGTGDHARAIAARWPDRRVEGVDHSADMLNKARAMPTPANLAWREADLRDWSAPERAALIFSNATLHWLPDHRALFSRLMAAVAPGGTLAVQMPGNFREPSHTLIRELAMTPPYRAKIGALTAPGGSLRDDLVEAPDFYYGVLAPLAAGSIDLWETTYLTAFTGERPVLAWIKGSILRPALARLDAAERENFEDQLAARLAAAYPQRADGVTLFPFRRLFFMARR
ncbi:MAG TPA: methyltransferase domain-containing protein [Stellaceae bacterium]|jgi:trans-aconitate 2-methyltransferase|nr:methyltransferase domain-containing protein [Stellaceae bacterium]